KVLRRGWYHPRHVPESPAAAVGACSDGAARRVQRERCPKREGEGPAIGPVARGSGRDSSGTRAIRGRGSRRPACGWLSRGKGRRSKVTHAYVCGDPFFNRQLAL